jgi:hypothetical protein
MVNTHRFPPPWSADKIPGGYVVCDANGQALVYVYSRDNEDEARQAKVLAKDEARRIGGLSMSRAPSKKPGAEAAPAKMYRCAVYRLKSTPASLLCHVEAPDAETAVKKAIDEFAIEPALHKRLLAQRRA